MAEVNKLSIYNYTPIKCTRNNRPNQISFKENLTVNSLENNNKRLSATQKIGMLSSIIGLITWGIFAIVKKHNANQIKEAQQIFKDMFIRNDISVDETKSILKRYKDLRKIEDKDEYITALFEETRKNFGLGKELKLELLDLPDTAHGGGNFSLTDTISLNKNWSRKKLENATFHELRHAKQDYLAINYDVDKFLQSNGINDVTKKAHIIPFLQRKCGLTDFSKNNVPTEYFNYVENCYKGYSDYVAIRFMPKSAERYKLYRNNFLEQDAWNNANKITKLLYNFELK